MKIPKIDGIDLNVGYEYISSLENGREKAIQYAVCGLLTDGSHHKQWCLEEVIKALGINIKTLRKSLQKGDYDWEDGIAP